MTDITEGLDPLYIILVIHQAMIDVNEKGTEAAAVTVIMMGIGSAIDVRPFIPDFRADRPFLYLILHRETNSVLFLGRMTKPAA